MRIAGDSLGQWAVFVGVFVVAAIPAALVMEAFDLEWGGYRGGTFGTLQLAFAGLVFVLGALVRHVVKSRRR